MKAKNSGIIEYTQIYDHHTADHKYSLDMHIILYFYIKIILDAEKSKIILRYMQCLVLTTPKDPIPQFLDIHSPFSAVFKKQTWAPQYLSQKIRMIATKT